MEWTIWTIAAVFFLLVGVAIAGLMLVLIAIIVGYTIEIFGKVIGNLS
jgi:hypothetical protein